MLQEGYTSRTSSTSETHHIESSSPPRRPKRSRTSSSDFDSCSDAVEDGDCRRSIITPSETYQYGPLHLSKYLHSRQMHLGNFTPPRSTPTITAAAAERQGLHDIVARKNVDLLNQREFDTTGYDKIFASAWLNDSEVVMASKCNQLLVLNVVTGARRQMPTVTIPESILYPNNTASNAPHPSHCTGIHCIAINSSKTMLAIGAGRPTEITVYSLPSFEPIAVCSAHTDMVFSLTFIDDDTIVSGSRDTTLKVWNLKDLSSNDLARKVHSPITNTDMYIVSPKLERREHTAKVRDLTYSPTTNQLMTLGGDGVVKVFDVNRFKVTKEVPLRHTRETVCMEDSQYHLVAVGSQGHVSLLDMRSGKFVHDIESLDECWGVRSMDISNALITIGGGMGRLSFYDLRAMKYMNVDSEYSTRTKNDSQVTTTSDVDSSLYLEAGDGYLYRDTTFLQHFSSITVRNAIYTLAYNSTRTQLFTAGGPLHLHLKGSYAAIW